MTRLLRCLGLACALFAPWAVAPASAAGKKHDDTYVGDFKGWEVVCDNVTRCTAEGTDDSGSGNSLVVWLQRDAGPDGAAKLQIAADTPLDANRMRLDGHPFAVDRSKWTLWQDKDAQTYGYRLATEDAGTVSAWVAAARDAGTVSFGDPAAAATPKLSLAGLSAALLAIDDRQGRIGTVTAWRRAGSSPASAVPVAKPLPVIGPATPGPSLSDAERQRLIKSTFAQFHADVDRCDVGLDDDDVKGALRHGSTAGALSDSEALVSLGCGDSSAYNPTSLWYRVSRHSPFSAKPFAPGEDAKSGNDDDAPPNQLTSADYDASKGEFEIFDRVRGIGDCGDLMTWIFDGAKFVMARRRFEGACAGVFVDDWPSLYRTKEK
ncbi:DUF1176 domain-containing protein [Trinickia acidisoli]|uniref:DUF1176 domain-containing protein n=1 Tax=Trinickia acidisoli TaxID=2767482 RepID=UPI001A8E1F26|nr:DUF1176 domain-containing protein [Trinickia acidisoli]